MENKTFKSGSYHLLFVCLFVLEEKKVLKVDSMWKIFYDTAVVIDALKPNPIGLIQAEGHLPVWIMFADLTTLLYH